MTTKSSLDGSAAMRAMKAMKQRTSWQKRGLPKMHSSWSGTHLWSLALLSGLTSRTCFLIIGTGYGKTITLVVRQKFSSQMLTYESLLRLIVTLALFSVLSSTSLQDTTSLTAMLALFPLALMIPLQGPVATVMKTWKPQSISLHLAQTSAPNGWTSTVSIACRARR